MSYLKTHAHAICPVFLGCLDAEFRKSTTCSIPVAPLYFQQSPVINTSGKTMFLRAARAARGPGARAAVRRATRTSGLEGTRDDSCDDTAISRLKERKIVTKNLFEGIVLLRLMGVSVRISIVTRALIVKVSRVRRVRTFVIFLNMTPRLVLENKRVENRLFLVAELQYAVEMDIRLLSLALAELLEGSL